ncbi:hypothetical protein EMCRGX_G026080 [Ephydatia muelleri]
MEAFLKLSVRSSKGTAQKSAEKPERKNIPWVEKYRPHSVDDLVYQDEVVTVLKKCLQGADVPNLLFYGPPGTGKTSAILAVSRQLYGAELFKSRVLELNASDERGIQVVREKIKSFAQQSVSSTLRADGHTSPSFKIIILDEADSMTNSAQAALRRTMEKESKTTRFCLICNYVSRIIEPLTSRCSKFRFKPLAIDVLKSRLEYIAEKEGVNCQQGVIDKMVQVSEGDLRKAITFLQSAHRYKTGDAIAPKDILEIAGVIPEHIIEGLIKACYSDCYDQLQTCVKSLMAEGYSCAQTINQLHDRLVTDESLTDQCKSVISERMGLVDKRLLDGADEFLQMMDLCTVIMNQFCHPT